jgi:hypothetical protein
MGLTISFCSAVVVVVFRFRSRSAKARLLVYFLSSYLVPIALLTAEIYSIIHKNGRHALLSLAAIGLYALFGFVVTVFNDAKLIGPGSDVGWSDQFIKSLTTTFFIVYAGATILFELASRGRLKTKAAS